MWLPSPLRRACPPPPHIKKAFDLKWYKVTRRAPKGQGTGVYDPPSPRPYPPLGRGERVEVKGDRTPLYPAPSGPSS